MKPIDPIVIGIAGASGSGKSYLAKKIKSELDQVVLIEQDSFYKDFSGKSELERNQLNFDHPDAIDFLALAQCVQELKSYQVTSIPNYDFTTHQRTTVSTHLNPQPIIIVEGILVLQSKELQGLLDIQIFVDTPIDYCIIRRLQRDISERGRTVDSVVEQYLKTVRPMFFQYVAPQKELADIVVSGLKENISIVELMKIKDRGNQ